MTLLSTRQQDRRNSAVVLLSSLILFLNALPMAVVGLRAHGRFYYLRSTDLFLAREETRAVFAENPGIENVLLPGIGFFLKQLLELVALEYTPAHFYVLSILPYLAFFLLAGWLFSRRSDPWFTVAVSAALFGSGIVPYMFTWGGYVDGLSYLLILLAYRWLPRSMPLALLMTALATLNHYMGTLVIVVAAAAFFVERAERRYLFFVGGAGAMLAVSQLAWSIGFPDASSVRTAVLLEKLQAGWGLIREVYGPTPWNLLSPLKLTTIPILFAVAYPRWLPWRSRLAIALPLLAGALAIVGFVDVTRTATHFFVVSFLLLLTAMERHASRPSAALDPAETCRRIFRITALASALLPVYYVNNGGVILVRWSALWGAIARLFD